MMTPRRTRTLLARALGVTLLASLSLSLPACAPSDIQYKIDSIYSVDDPQFQRTMGNLLGPPIIPGNRIDTLVNGDEIFPAMLAAIGSAKHTITMETFVYWSGDIGKAFTDALTDKAAAGVRVHVLIDAVGSTNIDPDYISQMRKAGAEVILYHALHWFDLGSAKKINFRTHRKLLIVDGTVGFTGGVGIADEWMGNAQDKDHWRDSHYRVQGPVVAQLQAAFLDNWMESTGEVLHGPDYFPQIQDAGPEFAQMFKSSSQGGSESMHLMFLLSIAAARTSILFSTPYFVLDELTTKQILDARARGVRVVIIVPGKHIDMELVRDASRAGWGDLLKSGVEIYEYQPTMYHTKLMVVDGFWTSIGSSNLDNRSFKLNAEANLNVLDGPFAARQSEIFWNDVERSKRITYEMWRSRPMIDRVKGGAASLLDPEL
jgi:cardiolipin synthase A/B